MAYPCPTNIIEVSRRGEGFLVWRPESRGYFTEKIFADLESATTYAEQQCRRIGGQIQFSGCLYPKHLDPNQ